MMISTPLYSIKGKEKHTRLRQSLVIIRAVSIRCHTSYPNEGSEHSASKVNNTELVTNIGLKISMVSNFRCV